MQILQLLLTGKTTQGIASELGIKSNTVSTITNRIFEKLHNISKNNRESNSRFNYSVFINDMRHYQVLKINKKIINNYREVSDFLSPKNNFTFSQKSIRSSSNK